MATVELATARWRRSSYSGGAGNGGNCVEVALLDTTVALRDSKTPQSGVLDLTPRAWTHLRAAVRD